MKSRSVTIKDIAKELNISVSTVSRALRDLPDVNQETKQAVVSLANSLNYKPNSSALSLVENRPHTLGIIIPGFLIHFYASAISGIQHVASQTGYNVMICQSNESFETEVNNTRALISSNIDGLIVSISKETTNTEHFKQLHRKGFPLIFFNRVCEDIDAPKVTVDDYDGAYQAVKHLIKTGCKRIAHLAGPKNLLLSKQRLNGYLDALLDHNLPVKNEYIIHGDFTMENGIECGNYLVNLPEPPDGVFCVCDTSAFGLMLAIREKGFKIPQDISLVGFTDEPSTLIVDPTLTSVRQPTFAIGKAAADLFLERLVHDSKNYNRQIVLKTELVTRNSTKKLIS
ncbi:MAG: LacI family DNA-binding transcriptional regulator [Candidatus Cyclobacteriaceae bacterium M3_2C_046]